MKEKLSICSIEYFGLALEEQYNISRLHLLHEEELIQQVGRAAPLWGAQTGLARTSAGTFVGRARLIRRFHARPSIPADIKLTKFGANRSGISPVFHLLSYKVGRVKV